MPRPQSEHPGPSGPPTTQANVVAWINGGHRRVALEKLHVHDLFTLGRAFVRPPKNATYTLQLLLSPTYLSKGHLVPRDPSLL